MNTKHTPGNWRFAWHNNHDAQITFACVVLDDEVVVIGHGEEKVAKAHLIAAAPELLEALINLLGPEDDPRIGWWGRAKASSDHFRCEHCGVEDLDCAKLQHKPDCRVVKARAAIAEATGA